MKKLTLKDLRKNGIELANFTLRAFSINGHRYNYESNKPIKAYIFYYEKDYIVYMYINQNPNCEHYDTFEDAQKRLVRFITIVNEK